MGGEGWPVEGVAHPLRGRGQTTGAGLPRKALPDGAHTLAEAGPVIPRWGAEAVGWEEGVPEPGSRGSRQTKQVLCALCRAPAATARGAPGAARRDPGLRPRRSLEHRARLGPSLSEVSAFLPGRREVGIEAFFVVRIEALPEIPSLGPSLLPEIPTLEIPLFGERAWRGREGTSLIFIRCFSSEDIPHVLGKGPGWSRW